MLHFEGDKDFAQAPAELWAKLSDARFLVQCLPEVQSVSRSERQVVECALRPGLSFARGTLQTTIQVVEATEPASIRLQAQSKGIGANSAVEATLTLLPRDGGTRVHWVAAITQLGGLLKAVPQGLLQASAQKVIETSWAAIAAKIGGVA